MSDEDAIAMITPETDDILVDDSAEPKNANTPHDASESAVEESE